MAGKQAPKLPRSRLVRSVMAGLRRGPVLITAPAGFGKTTLLQAVLQQRPNTYYLRLTPTDVDRAHLAGRLVPLLIDSATVLLDDVHHLQDAANALSWLNQHINNRANHFVLSGRREPDPAWGTRFFRITHEHLAFSAVEARALLGPSRQFTGAGIMAWHARTKGWPIALAVLVRQIGEPGMALPDTVLIPPSDHVGTSLLAYLAERLIRTLPEQLFEFIQTVAHPMEFNDELAAVLTAGSITLAAHLRGEVEQRSLFIEHAEVDGWFRFHDYVRDYLIDRLARSSPERSCATLARAADWFESQGDLPAAVDHALLAGQPEQASRILAALEEHWVWSAGRSQTYRRWVLSLPRTVLERHPRHLAQLSRVLFDVDKYDEAQQLMRDALLIVNESTDGQVRAWVKDAAALQAGRVGHSDEAMRLATEALNEPDLAPTTRQSALNTRASNLALQGRLRAAKPVFEQALALAQTLGNATNIFRVQHNLSLLVNQPLGNFVEARRLLKANDAFCADKPGWRNRHLLGWAGLHEALGEWSELADCVRQMELTNIELEERGEDRIWEYWFGAFALGGGGDYAAAEAKLDHMHTAAHTQADGPASEQWARAWLLRKRGDLAGCIALADRELPLHGDAPYYQSAIAFERACAALSLNSAEPSWIAPAAPYIRMHHQLRARAYMLRWRAMLAVTGQACGHPRWRAHARAAMRLSADASLTEILVHREPELGGLFQAMLIAGGLGGREVEASLARTGHIAAALALLNSSDSRVITRAVTAIRAIGDERAIPALTAALARQTDSPARSSLGRAVHVLQEASPPVITVQLMGAFSLKRGEAVIDDAAWQRPSARLLLQYLALHAGKSLVREKVIDDLWPNAGPAAGRDAFKTALSRVRKVVEPFLSAKAHIRYWSADGDMIHVHQDYLQTDMAVFERECRAALVSADRGDNPELHTVQQALLQWAPLLPGAQNEAWTVQPRERLHDLYVRACAMVGQAYLETNLLPEAAQWAERAIVVAPWSEECYQTLMRAQSRQGNRTGALHTHAVCVNALDRELGVHVSELTAWLGSRLRRGEPI